MHISDDEQERRFGARAADPATFRRWTVDKPSASDKAIAAATAIAIAEAPLRAAWQPLGADSRPSS